MPSLVPHPKTGKPVWDYDLPVEDEQKPTKKAAAKKAADKGEES